MKIKIFESKNIGLFKKLVIFVIILIIIFFSLAGESKAKDNTKGGKLLNPVAELLVFTGDGIMNIVHTVLYNQTDTTITVDFAASILSKIATIAVGVVAAAGAAVLCVVTCGAFAAALATIGVSIATVSAATVIVVSATSGICAAVAFNSNVLPDVIEIPVYQLSPDKIFENKILMFDVDFFNPKEDEPLRDRDGNVVKNSDGSVKYSQSTAKQLRATISNWYTILRDIAVVALLSILVYVGIRILISSTSNDKAKYKQMLMDWVVAICLLFVMQYIMSFANLLVGKVTELVTSTKKASGYTTFIEDKNGKVSKKLDELGYSYEKEDVDGKTFITWPTNSLGFARLEAQMAKNENTSYAGYALMFWVLVLFTVYFIITYLKRVLYMAFLTLIAPMVAMTYPLDKMNDGKAQAFDMWFKEYIFNLLIQPMHLLLYTVLVSSAYELASTNILYSLVALGFMIPAEKLLRKFFGFEKAQTPGLLAGPAGAAITMSAMNKFLGLGPKPPKKEIGAKGDKSTSFDSGKPPRVNESFDKEGALFGDGNTEDKSNNGVNQQRYLFKDEEGNTVAGADSYQKNEDGTTRWYGFNQTDDSKIPVSGVNMENNKVVPTVDGTRIRVEENPYFRKINDGNTNDTSVNDSPYKMNFNNLENDGSNIGFAERFKMNTRGTMKDLRYTGKGLKKKIKNKVENARPLEAGVKFVAGGAMALGAGALTAGVSLASGKNPEELAKNVGMVAAAGYKSGSGTVLAMQNALKVDGADEIREAGKYDSEEQRKQVEQEEYVKEYQKDYKKQAELERRFGKEKSANIMKNDIPILLNNGVSDMEDISTILEMRDKGQIKDINEGIGIKKYASRIGADTTKGMSKKKKEEWRDTFKNEYENSAKWKGYNHDQMADYLMGQIDSYNKIKYSK